MSARELIESLLGAGAVEKRTDGLSFTHAFGRYLARYISNDPKKAATLEGWRDLLGEFDPSLKNLKTDRIVDFVRLLGYHLRCVETLKKEDQ